MENNSLQKSVNGSEVKFIGNIIDLAKYPQAKEKIDRFIKEAKKVIFAASSAFVITTSLGASTEVNAKPAIEIENKKVFENLQDMVVKVNYKSFCLSIINEVQKEYALFGKDENLLYDKLAEMANGTDKGAHDFLIGSYGFLYGYDSEKFKTIMDKMHGYNYGDDSKENVEALYKKGGFDFNTKTIDFNELEKYCISYYNQNFYKNGIKDFKLGFIKTNAPKMEIEKPQETRMVNVDLIEEAQEILANIDDGDIKLYEFYMIHDESDLNKLLDTMAYIENQEYKTLEEYIHYRGFNDVQQWQEHVMLLKDNKNKGRAM